MWRRRMRTQREWKVEISGRGVSLEDRLFDANFGETRLAGRSLAAGTPHFREECGGPFLHFAGGFFRERDGEDAFRFDAVADERGDAIGDDAGFAGAGTGEDEKRAFERTDGVELRRVQIGGHRKSISRAAGDAIERREASSKKCCRIQRNGASWAVLAALAIICKRS